MPETCEAEYDDAGRAPASVGSGDVAAVASEIGMGGQAEARGGIATERAIAALPDAESAWPGISPEERERRRLVLADIAARVREDGPRTPSFDPDRGRLFMPFSALKGYSQMVEDGQDAALDEDLSQEASFCDEGDGFGVE